MFTDSMMLVAMYLFDKSGELLVEVLLSKLLSKLWEWLCQDKRVKQLRWSVKRHILAWYLTVLLTTGKKK